MDIGNELKALRKKCGFTQSELAAKCNLSKNSIWNYENNKRTPTVKVLKVICEALGVDLSYLIDSPITIDSNTGKALQELGWIEDIIPPVDIGDHQRLLEFNRFLASAQLPYDIPWNELEQVYPKVIAFLQFEFFKLGYVMIKDTKDTKK